MNDAAPARDDISASARLVQESGQDARVAQIIAPVIEDMGFRLVRARLYDNSGLTLQIMVEKPDGTMNVNECEAVSKAVSPVLDVEDPIPQAYSLEVSSPGIDRPLVRVSDFDTWAGHVAKLETASMVNGRKRFKGQIVKVDGDTLLMRREDAPAGEDKDFTIPLDGIASARLVLTDELIREALKRDKALREANENLGDVEDTPDN
ncbi:ribosome maturation factor RimP [Pseudahrensia aquimaris]|uniref:Ribosome maturation factor RimP n=1 Tax=Pseudahrensia aquimaris TaxID=744461 RepID=A0ABW3FHK5_9HYPH